MQMNPDVAAQMLKSQLQPWHEAVANPAAAQDAVLHRLLGEYAGQSHQIFFGKNPGCLR